VVKESEGKVFAKSASIQWSPVLQRTYSSSGPIVLSHGTPALRDSRRRPAARSIAVLIWPHSKGISTALNVGDTLTLLDIYRISVEIPGDRPWSAAPAATGHVRPL
jgi:hypothetical protein